MRACVTVAEAAPPGDHAPPEDDHHRADTGLATLARDTLVPDRSPRAAPKAPKIGALVAETIVLVNPQKNYAQFLLRALPMVIHVVIASGSLPVFENVVATS